MDYGICLNVLGKVMLPHVEDKMPLDWLLKQTYGKERRLSDNEFDALD